METIKKTVVEVRTTDGKIVNVGDLVVLAVNGYTIAGVFDGIGKKGSWRFKGVKGFDGVTFNLLPRTITCMYFAKIDVEKENQTC